MKKIISILIALATVLSLAACSVNGGKTTAELVAEAEAEQSKLVEESIQAEVERSENMGDSIAKIGKTEKNKRLVLKRPSLGTEHYQVYVMDRKGICDHVINYYYYESLESYNLKNEKPKVDTGEKKIESDPVTRMIAFKRDYDKDEGVTFDQLYKQFSDEAYTKEGFVIIE